MQLNRKCGLKINESKIIAKGFLSTMTFSDADNPLPLLTVSFSLIVLLHYRL